MNDPTPASNGDDLPVPFSYILRQAQHDFAKDYLGPLIWEALGGKSHVDDWSFDLSSWHADSQVINLGKAMDGAGPVSSWSYIHFEGFFFDPQGDFWYGKSDISADNPKEFTGQGWLANLADSDEPLPWSRSEEVSLTRERSTETTETVQMDIAVKSTTTGKVGGDEFGASLEQSVEASWGVSNTEEKKRAESESRSQTTTTQIDYNFPPRKDTLLTLETTTAHTSRPFIISAAMMWGKITVVLGFTRQRKRGNVEWWYHDYHHAELNKRATDHRNKGVSVKTDPNVWVDSDLPGDYEYENEQRRFEFSGLQDMVEKLTGKSVDWPGTVDHTPTRYVLDKVDAAWDKKNRIITLHGTESRVADGIVRVTTADVSGQDLAAVAQKHGLDENRIINHDS